MSYTKDQIISDILDDHREQLEAYSPVELIEEWENIMGEYNLGYFPASDTYVVTENDDDTLTDENRILTDGEVK